MTKTQSNYLICNYVYYAIIKQNYEQKQIRATIFESLTKCPSNYLLLLIQNSKIIKKMSKNIETISRVKNQQNCKQNLNKCTFMGNKTPKLIKKNKYNTEQPEANICS